MRRMILALWACSWPALAASGCDGSAGAPDADADVDGGTETDAAADERADADADGDADSGDEPDVNEDAEESTDSDETDDLPAIDGHDYPRIGAFQWNGGTADWLARFDLVVEAPTVVHSQNQSDADVIREVRARNPDATILATTDWNAGGFFRNDPGGLPAEWILHNSAGDRVPVYGDQDFADVTEYCGRYTGTINGYAVLDETYAEALARVLAETMDWELFDGVSSDGSWGAPGWTGDVDLDRDGSNDYSQHGSDWVREVWWAGQAQVRSLLRDRYATLFGSRDAKLITYWTGAELMAIDVSNGVGWENMQGYTVEEWLPKIAEWQRRGPLPRVNYVTGDTFMDGNNAPGGRPKDNFRFVRWALASTLLSDAYFITGDLRDHHWTNYYDEFDVPLGYPTTEPIALADGCYVRFFDHGAVIVNITDADQTVSEADLAGLEGYAGPYYRFQGNQDPVWNDGSLFETATFVSTEPSPSQSFPSELRHSIGDGLLLVGTPAVVVADVIADDAYAGTSPGTMEAALTGDWTRQAQSGAWFTCLGGSWGDERYAHAHYAEPGSGEASAVFHPGIRLAGRYRVSEWHGWVGGSPGDRTEATNVSVAIVHASGTASLVVDQSANPGQWNVLGTYSFPADGSSSVTITNEANGPVLADAFQFEWVGP
jgi:hypothetical protein